MWVVCFASKPTDNIRQENPVYLFDDLFMVLSVGDDLLMSVKESKIKVFFVIKKSKIFIY